MANPNVAADVNPLIIPAGKKFEPTHVGCYGIPNAAEATGRVARRTKHGDDGNLMQADGNSFPVFISGWTILDCANRAGAATALSGGREIY
jgi:hypothetical protein